ncbi:MAG: hypothetical protein KDI45_06785 [Candidatus Accumulibacter sp.]|nr:hypothetical protein [Accumulibacter sp.]MCB1965869.1 hypothetical protein [Accumulibacter sp.]
MRTQLHPFAVVLAAFLVGLGNPTHGADLAHLLDGKAFIGKNGEKGKALDPDQDEEIVFQDGRFTSVSCVPYNFSSAEYSARLVGDSVHFEAVTLSPTHGKIVWKGVVKGDTAQAEFVWTKERWYWDTRREYWFKGVREK